MAGIGPDISEVINELGVLIEILRIPTNISEKIIYDMNSQATKPFIREFHRDGSFSSDTKIETGDILHVLKTEEYLMVMNKTPDMFEDEIVEYASVLYKTNLPSTAKISRPSAAVRDADYNLTETWTDVVTRAYGVIADKLQGSNIDQEEPTGQIQIWAIEAFVPAAYGVKPLDRLYISATEYYKIEKVEKYRYPGIHALDLVEDTR